MQAKSPAELAAEYNDSTGRRIGELDVQIARATGRARTSGAAPAAGACQQSIPDTPRVHGKTASMLGHMKNSPREY